MKKYYIIKAENHTDLFNNDDIENHSFPISALAQPGTFAVECEYYENFYKAHSEYNMQYYI